MPGAVGWKVRSNDDGDILFLNKCFTLNKNESTKWEKSNLAAFPLLRPTAMRVFIHEENMLKVKYCTPMNSAKVNFKYAEQLSVRKKMKQ